MAKDIEKAKIYNKGNRSIDILDSTGRQWINPGKTIEVDKLVAEKYVAGYPKDLVLGESGGSQKIHNEFRKMKAENARLKAEIEELKGKKGKKADTGKKE